MDIEVRPVSDDELADFVRAQNRAFGIHARDEDVEAERGVFEAERSLAAFEGDRIVAGTAAATFRMTVPGGDLVPTAGITSVGVQPTHRRRGLLTALMRQQLEDIHQRGEPLAALWASEAAIYGRFGYGVAAPVLDVTVERAHSAFASPIDPVGVLRLVDRDEALRTFPRAYDRLLEVRSGVMERNEAWWRYGTADLEHWREGASQLFYVLLEGVDGPEGYAYYRVRHDWSQNLPANVVEVEQLLGATPRAEAQLWRYVLDIDLVAKVRAPYRPLDEPLQHFLADPRRMEAQVLDGLYVRVVDVPRALETRRYRAPGRVVLEVADAHCPWNEGRFALEGGPDGAACERTEAEPDVRLDATALGAAYLGGVRFVALARGLRAEGTAEGLARADSLFASDVAPWCPLDF